MLGGSQLDPHSPALGEPPVGHGKPHLFRTPTSTEPRGGMEAQDPAACLPLELKLAPMDLWMLSAKDSSVGETEALRKGGFLKATNKPLVHGSRAVYSTLVSRPVTDAEPLGRSLSFFFK